MCTSISAQHAKKFLSSHNIISKILLIGIWVFLTFLLLARVVGLYKLF